MASIKDVRYLNVYIMPNEIAFLRIPSVDRFGDSVDRKMVVVESALSGMKAESGFETGRAFSGLRAAAPVETDGKKDEKKTIIGVVEVGIGFDAILQDLRLSQKVDSAILLSKKYASSVMWSDVIASGGNSAIWKDRFFLVAETDNRLQDLYRLEAVRGLLISTASARGLMNRLGQIVVDLNGIPYVVSSLALDDEKTSRDPSGGPAGILVTWIPMQGYPSWSGLAGSLAYGLAGFAALMLIIYGTWWAGVWHIQKSVADRTEELSRKASELEEKSRQLDFVNKRLQRAERQYRSMYENAAQAMFQCTLDGRLIGVNPAMVRLLGYESAQDLLAIRNIYEELYSDMVKRQDWMKIIQEKEEVVNQEECLRHKDGSNVWVLTNVRLAESEDGDMIFEGIMVDNTARRAAEEELRLSEEKYRSIINGAYEGFVLMDPMHHILDANESTVRLLGYTREELIGRKIDQFQDSATRDFCSASAEHLSYRVTFIARDGRRIPVLFNRSIHKDTDGKILNLVGFFSDLTEMKEAQQES